MYRRILVALGGNRADQVLVDHVTRLAKDTGAELTLLRVIVHRFDTIKMVYAHQE